MNILAKIPSLLLVCCSLSIASPALAQGSLTPPGPPGPTMKALDQIEARTLVNPTNTPGNDTTHFVISQPGSYYLGGNLDVTRTVGISVQVADVTLDLNGFGVRRTGGISGVGILVTPFADRCVVKNGAISGFQKGLEADAGVIADGDNRRSRSGSALQLTATGCSAVGIEAGEGWEVFGCEAHNNGGDGIRAHRGSTIIQSTADLNGEYGINASGSHCTIVHSTARGNGSTGIRVIGSAKISHCNAGENGQHGISGSIGSSITHCVANDNLHSGVSGHARCLIADNSCSENTENGIYLVGGDNRVEGNNLTANARGMQVTDDGNFIVKNTAAGNTVVNYNIIANNKVGVIVNAPNSGLINGSASSTGIGTSEPWANFSY